MSRQQNQLASELLRKVFGPCVDAVGLCLLRSGPLDLRGIKCRIQLPMITIKKSLRVLINHHIVTFTIRATSVQYKAHIGHILRILRYSRIIQAANSRFGPIGKEIITLLMVSGMSSMSEVIIDVAASLQEGDAAAKMADISKIFKRMAKEEVIVRCKTVKVNDSKDNITSEKNDNQEKDDNYEIPELDLTKLVKKITNSSEKCTFPDEKVYWRVDFYGFYAEFRDKSIMYAVEQNNDSIAAKVMSIALKLNTLNAVSWNTQSSGHLHQHDFVELSKELGLSGVDIFNGLSTLHGGFNDFITPVDTATYVIHFKNIIRRIVFNTIEMEIQETLGLYCRRIFTILLMEKDQDEDSIFKKVLLPQKVARENLQKLITHGHLEFKELSENEGHGPPKTNYVFRVNEIQVVRTMLERHYAAAVKLLTKESIEIESNMRYTEKNNKFNLMIENLKVQGVNSDELEELEDILTQEEKNFIARLRKITRQLNMGLIKIDETILLLELYLVFEDIAF